MSFIHSLFKESFELIKVNMVLVHALVFFFIVLSILLMPVGAISSDRALIVVFISIGLLFSVFFSGWVNMFYVLVTNPSNPNLTAAEQTLKSFHLFKEFFPGVTLYFLPVIGGLLLYTAILAIFAIAIYSYGLENIGIPMAFTNEEFLSKMMETNSFSELSANISPLMKEQIAKWYGLLLLFSMIKLFVDYLTMFWIQGVLFCQVNPVRGFIKSIQMVAKDPINTLIIVLLMFFGNMIANFLAIVPNFLISIIGLLLTLFVSTYFLLVKFLYFEKKASYSHSRADCFR